VANIYAALVQKVSKVAKRQSKSDIHQYAKLNDLGRGLQGPERVRAHFSMLTALPGPLKVGSPDITHQDAKLDKLGRTLEVTEWIPRHFLRLHHWIDLLEPVFAEITALNLAVQLPRHEPYEDKS